MRKYIQQTDSRSRRGDDMRINHPQKLLALAPNGGGLPGRIDRCCPARIADYLQLDYRQWQLEYCR